MDADKYSEAMNAGIMMATAFWVAVMLMFACCAYDHGKYVGELEAKVPEVADEKENNE